MFRLLDAKGETITESVSYPDKVACKKWIAAIKKVVPTAETEDTTEEKAESKKPAVKKEAKKPAKAKAGAKTEAAREEKKFREEEAKR